MMHLAVAVNDRSGDMIPFVVSLFTWAKAWHVELIFSDGVTISASPEQVGYRTAHYGRYKWVLVPLPQISEEDEQQIRDLADDIAIRNPKYDYLGAILGRLVPTAQDSNKWYCSELCRYLLKSKIPSLDDKKWITPDRLWRTVVDDVHKTHPELVDAKTIVNSIYPVQAVEVPIKTK